MTVDINEIVKNAKAIRAAGPERPRWLPLPSGAVRDVLFLTRDQRDRFPGVGAYNAHPRFVLWICLEGDTGLYAEPETRRLRAGEAFLTFPWQPHARLPLSETGLWQLVSFNMDNGDMFEDIRGRVCRVSPKAAEILREAQTLFLDGLRDQKAPRELGFLIGLLTCEIARHPIGDAVRETPSEDDTRKKAETIVPIVCEHIYKHYDRDLDVAALAKAARVSESHLRAVFKKRLRVSVGKFAAKAKMAVAADLLSRSSLNVTEIAAKCGYNSLFAFSRAFKTRQGLSPLEHRAKARGSAARDDASGRLGGNDET